MDFTEWKRLRTALGKNTPIMPDEIWNAAKADEREVCAKVCRAWEYSDAGNILAERIMMRSNV